MYLNLSGYPGYFKEFYQIFFSQFFDDLVLKIHASTDLMNLFGYLSKFLSSSARKVKRG